MSDFTGRTLEGKVRMMTRRELESFAIQQAERADRLAGIANSLAQ